MEIRGVSISYSSFKRKEKDKSEKNLIGDINEIELYPMPLTADTSILLDEKKNTIRKSEKRENSR